MKIDAAAVTQVVSNTYALRHRILPIAVTPEYVVFATCEPFETRWAADLAQMLRRDIRLVVANPLDIQRYLTELYGVQRSIQLAHDAKGEMPMPARPSSISSSWWNWARAASSAPTTVTSCTSSTGCCSTRSSSAPRTSIWNRAATAARCASASTA